MFWNVVLFVLFYVEFYDDRSTTGKGEMGFICRDVSAILIISVLFSSSPDSQAIDLEEKRNKNLMDFIRQDMHFSLSPNPPSPPFLLPKSGKRSIIVKLISICLNVLVNFIFRSLYSVSANYKQRESRFMILLNDCKTFFGFSVFTDNLMRL